MGNTVKLTIDGHVLEAAAGTSVLNAALDAGIYIPHLCYHPNLPAEGECKLCVCHISGHEGMTTACTTPVEDGMVVTTDAPDLKEARCLSVELMLANHPEDCTTCTKYGNCELQSIRQKLGVSDERLRKGKINNYFCGDNPLYNRDLRRCILCGRCVRVCRDVRGVGALDFTTDENGVVSVMPISGDGSMANSGCRFCGACVEVCPTGALLDKPERMEKYPTKEQALVPCRAECPIHTDVPRYLALIRAGKYDEALEVIREVNPFPGSLGLICMRFCEKACRRGDVNCAVNIRGMKYLAYKNGGKTWESQVVTKPSTGKKVAVIGAGPAGLTAAYYLQLQGHQATVFERNPVAGGMLAVGIPKERLPQEIVDDEVADILATGVKIEYNKNITDAKALLADYDAVIVTVGTNTGSRIPIPGHDFEGVYTGVEFLRAHALHEPCPMPESVLVLGGGNVAFDVANTAYLEGAKTVYMACLEARDAMTASDDEIEEGLEKGIQLHNACSFKQITREENGQLTFHYNKIASMKNEGGRFIVEEVPDSAGSITADAIIFATGQHSGLNAEFGVELGRGNRVATNNAMTSVPGIFAAGDCVTGTASVVGAIAGGREAAVHCDIFLGGDGQILRPLAPETEYDPHIGKYEDFAELMRFENMDDAQAAKEAERCMQCHLRLNIERVPFWNEYQIQE